MKTEPEVFSFDDLTQVVREGYPDHLSRDPKSRYYDEKLKGKKETPWVMVDVQATHSLKLLELGKPTKL